MGDILLYHSSTVKLTPCPKWMWREWLKAVRLPCLLLECPNWTHGWATQRWATKRWATQRWAARRGATLLLDALFQKKFWRLHWKLCIIQCHSKMVSFHDVTKVKLTDSVWTESVRCDAIVGRSHPVKAQCNTVYNNPIVTLWLNSSWIIQWVRHYGFMG